MPFQVDDQSLNAGLDQGRNVGEAGALARGDGDARLAGAMQLDRRRHFGEHQVHVSGDQIIERRRGPLIGHVHQLGARPRLETVRPSDAMSCRSLATRSSACRVVRACDELLRRARRKIRDRQRVGNCGHDGDRHERGRVVIELAIKQRVDGERWAARPSGYSRPAAPRTRLRRRNCRPVRRGSRPRPFGRAVGAAGWQQSWSAESTPPPGGTVTIMRIGWFG